MTVYLDTMICASFHCTLIRRDVQSEKKKKRTEKTFNGFYSEMLWGEHRLSDVGRFNIISGANYV